MLVPPFFHEGSVIRAKYENRDTFLFPSEMEERKDKGLSVQKNTNYGSVALEPRLKREKGIIIKAATSSELQSARSPASAPSRTS